MDLELIEKELKALLMTEGYHLYSLNLYKDEGSKILEVLVEESLDLDTISVLSQKISAHLDELDKSEEAYLLDVSCAGAERELTDEDQISKAVGSYIHVEANDEIYEGELLSFKDGVLEIAYKLKNLNKKIKIEKERITLIRLAVKF